ncbi:hypothetical protein TSAR_002985 [Trichomalopsis sarcophagae]|uniref:Uncharacterized protein n=1 Tax=Trichomalopsis sarcophagae TaxID=543379 RepID=A0A232FCV9_9HYME|nr:hypothetical protein TSAR_002985 [Trichomalopsis sarcophagae]
MLKAEVSAVRDLSTLEDNQKLCNPAFKDIFTYTTPHELVYSNQILSLRKPLNFRRTPAHCSDNRRRVVDIICITTHYNDAILQRKTIFPVRGSGLTILKIHEYWLVIPLFSAITSSHTIQSLDTLRPNSDENMYYFLIKKI